MNILDYNNALNDYYNNPNAINYNNALSWIPPQLNSSPARSSAPAAGPSYSTVNNTAPAAPTDNSAQALQAYQNELNDLNQKTNDTYNNLQGLYQNQFNNQKNYYDTTNQNLLGTQSSADSTKFLNSIEDPLLKQQGLYQYQYGLDTGHENNLYGLQSGANQLQQTAISQNRQLALDKLANDEKWAMKGIDLNQSKDNAATIDSLNGRGMLYGQQPTGGYNPTAMGGMTGVAGQTAGLVNTDYANQRGNLGSTYNLNQQGINQDYTQQHNMLQNQLGQLNENHNYSLKNYAMNTSNNINNQNNQYAFNNAQNNNQLALYKANLKQQQADAQNTNAQTAKLLSGGSYQ